MDWVPTLRARRMGSYLLFLQRRRKRLLELHGLVFVGHLQRVKEAAATDLELRLRARLLDLHAAGILPSSNLEELPDLGDLLRHDDVGTETAEACQDEQA